MTTFVLVHGASHGSWCWDKVVPLLAAQGHEAIAVDLPGNTYGEFDIPVGEVTLQSYTDHVCKVIDKQAEAVVLVGHSLGGLTITQSAECRPDKISTLVYLTALLLGDGQAMRPVESRDPRAVMFALKRDSWTVSDDLSTIVFNENSLRDRFYNDCTDDDFAWAKTMLVPQPSGPLMDTVSTTLGKYGTVDKVYIECVLDGALSLPYQREMQANVSCERIITINTGHSPFLSAPEELAMHLMSV